MDPVKGKSGNCCKKFINYARVPDEIIDLLSTFMKITDPGWIRESLFHLKTVETPPAFYLLKQFLR